MNDKQRRTVRWWFVAILVFGVLLVPWQYRENMRADWSADGYRPLFAPPRLVVVKEVDAVLIEGLTRTEVVRSWDAVRVDRRRLLIELVMISFLSAGLYWHYGEASDDTEG
jgi:hypothetical protein